MSGPSTMTLIYTSAAPLEFPRLDVARELRDLMDHLRPIGAHWLSRLSLQVTVDRLCMDLAHPPRPQILHFSGHGDPECGDIWMCRPNGRDAMRATARGLAEMVRPFAPHLKLCVWLACFTSELAQCMTEHVDAAIGVEGQIDDVIASPFTPTLHAMLACGHPLDTAFEVAKGRLETTFPGQGHSIKLYKRAGVDEVHISAAPPMKLRIAIESLSSETAAVSAWLPAEPRPTSSRIDERGRHALTTDTHAIIDIDIASVRVRIHAPRCSSTAGQFVQVIIDGVEYELPPLQQYASDKMGNKPCITHDHYFERRKLVSRRSPSSSA